MRGSRTKATRRALAHENRALGTAVNANREAALALYATANCYLWQAFWQSVAVAALLAYIDARRGAPDGPMAVVVWAEVEHAMWFWPSETVI